jgi:hypothetical protein
MTRAIISTLFFVVGCGSGDGLDLGTAYHGSSAPQIAARVPAPVKTPRPTLANHAAATVDEPDAGAPEPDLAAPGLDKTQDGGAPVDCEALTPCARHITQANLDTGSPGCANILFAAGTAQPGDAICLHPDTDPEQRRSPVRVFRLGAELEGKCAYHSVRVVRFSVAELPNPSGYRPRVCN